MRLETIHPRELGPAEIARWRSHQRAGVGLASPYLTPEWAQIVGAARADARVCVIEDGAGYFAAQRLSSFSAMGLGAPIADYQGVVSAAGLEIAPGALCRALGVGRIDITHAPAGQGWLRPSYSEESWIADVSAGREIYEAGLRARRGEFARQLGKKQRKLARDRAPAVFAVSCARADFETLLAWKRAQLKASGQPQIWDVPWVRQTIEACFERSDHAFSGLLFTLRAGERLAAANFCLRAGPVLHMWIIGHDDFFEAYSPGVQLSHWICGWAAERGLAEVDFGPGAYRYKRQLSNSARPLHWGVASGASWSGAVRRAAYDVRRQWEKLPQERLAALPGKAMRRLDLMRALAA